MIALQIIVCWFGSSILFVGAVLICRALANAKPRRPDWRAPLYRALLPR